MSAEWYIDLAMDVCEHCGEHVYYEVLTRNSLAAEDLERDRALRAMGWVVGVDGAYCPGCAML